MAGNQEQTLSHYPLRIISLQLNFFDISLIIHFYFDILQNIHNRRYVWIKYYFHPAQKSIIILGADRVSGHLKTEGYKWRNEDLG